MKQTYFFSLVAFFLISCQNGFSQVTSIPPAAKENFSKQYPDAQHVDWDNDVIHVHVRFELDGATMSAEYNNKGIWKDTYKDWTYDKVPAEIQDGFKKSKYASRDVTDVKIIYYPGDVQEYRLKVEKNDLQKKYLFFNTKGRLLRESITI